MQKKSKIDLIRIMATCHLNIEPFIDNNLCLAPIKLLELTEESIIERFKYHFMQTAIRLNKKRNIHTLGTIYDERIDEEPSRQASLIRDMTLNEFLSLLTKGMPILESEQTGWIKKDKTFLYKLTFTLIDHIIKSYSDQKKYGATVARGYKLNTAIELYNNERELYLYGYDLASMNSFSTDELYCNCLVLLDNCVSINYASNRNQTLIHIKKKYFEVDEIVNPLQGFIKKQPESVDWAWEYLLKKIDLGLTEPRIKPNTSLLDCIVYRIGYQYVETIDGKNKILEIDKSMRKAWSVMNTRKRNNKIKPLTLSKRHYDKLQLLAKKDGVSEKVYISKLIDKELI